MRQNDRHVGELLQTEYDELLSRLVDGDSMVSWCRYRHHNDPEAQRNMEEFIAFARKHGRRRIVTSSGLERKPAATTEDGEPE